MRSNNFSKSLLVLIVSALITTSSSNSFAQKRFGSNDAWSDSTRFERCIPNLTADQKTKIESLKVKHLKEVTPLRNELAEKRAHLTTLESAEKPDKDAINKTIDEISTLHGKIMKMNANHRLEVSSNLTDDQKVIFNSHRGMKQGMGRGMGKGMGRGANDKHCPNYPDCPYRGK